MRVDRFITRLSARIARLGRRDDGATLVEFALAVPLFLLIFFGLIDFGRLAFHWVTAERALYTAARVAAVRPPICAGVPTQHQQGASAARFGTMCSAGAGTCVNPGNFTCAAGADPTSVEIWGLVRGSLPLNATSANLQFTYSFDQNLGFVGGPYVPMITVQLTNLNFQFFTPLSGLVSLVGGTPPAGLGAQIPMTNLSVSLPGEDLDLGTLG